MLRYEYAAKDTLTSSCTTGARSLMAYVLANVEGATDLGCFNPSLIPGSTTYSIHAEGRAIDPGTPDAEVRARMAAFVERLIAHSDELGVQCVIHQKRIWSTAVDTRVLPFSAWRPLSNWQAVGDHMNHAHIELVRERAAGANALTVAYIDSILNPVTHAQEAAEVQTKIIVPTTGDPNDRDENGWAKTATWARFVGLFDGKVVPFMAWLEDQETVNAYEALGYLEPKEVLFVHVDSCRNIALTTTAPTTDDAPFRAAKGRTWSAADFLSTVG